VGSGGFVDAVATHGVVLTGSALGDMVPAQLGASDALLTATGGPLGLSPATALALTLALHGTQVGAALLGAALAALVPDGAAEAVA
jgi:hypothetical protein